MLTALRQIPDLEGVQSPLVNFYLGIMFIVCGVHTTLETRRLYAPRGVSADPGWNTQDPATIGEILRKILKFDCSDPTVFVQRVKGLFCDAVYGVQTKDANDGLLVKQLVELAFNANMVKFVYASTQKTAPRESCDVRQNFMNVNNCTELV